MSGELGLALIGVGLFACGGLMLVGLAQASRSRRLAGRQQVRVCWSGLPRSHSQLKRRNRRAIFRSNLAYNFANALLWLIVAYIFGSQLLVVMSWEWLLGLILGLSGCLYYLTRTFARLEVYDQGLVVRQLWRHRVIYFTNGDILSSYQTAGIFSQHTHSGYQLERQQKIILRLNNRFFLSLNTLPQVLLTLPGVNQ